MSGLQDLLKLLLIVAPYRWLWKREPFFSQMCHVCSLTFLKGIWH